MTNERADSKPYNTDLALGAEADAGFVLPPVHINAQDDAAAIRQWLDEYRDSPQTFRHYRKEAERLMLWLTARQARLADMNRRMLDEFDAFLADPQPCERWIGPTRPRHSPQWRPFRNALSAASRRQTLVILQGMFAWLVEAGWLQHNPFRLMRDKRRRLDNRHEGIERYLERPLWQWLWQRLDTPLDEAASPREHYCHARLRFIFGFAYLLGPRISEMSAARMNDFFKREGQWWWRVVGKGSKLAQIPVAPAMQALLSDWRAALGLAGMPDYTEDTPVIRALNGSDPISDNQLYRLIKRVFSDAADTLEQQDGKPTELARQLRRASPHWLRHTAITHQAQAGVELRYLAKTARHSRLDTTARYLHAEAQEWQHQLARHTLTRQETDEGSDHSL